MEEESKIENFYNHKMEELQLATEELKQEGGIAVSAEEMEIKKLGEALEDEPSLEILVSLAKQGDLNPWDVDLESVTSSYLQAIKDNPIDCLREAGRAIFYASILLRMKSDMLAAQSEEALNIGVHKELDDDALLEAELADRQTTQVTFNDLEAAIRRKYIQKAKRFRKLTLQDLISALQDAKEEEENRVERYEQRRLFELEGYDIIAPELGDDLMELTHAENLEDAIERLEAILPEYLLDSKALEFKEIVEILGNWSNAFLATIFLAHDHQVELEQENFYGELWLHESK